MLLLVPLLMIFAGFLLRFGLNLAYGVRGPESDNVFLLSVQLISWLLMGGGLVLWSLLPLAGSVGALVICILLWVLVGFAVVDAVRSTREMHRRTIGKLLAISVREGQLRRVHDLFSQVQPGWFVGEAATQLAYALDAGEPLYESVARNRAALPREAPAYAAIGTLTSAEADALDELSRPDDPQLAGAWRWWFDHFAYGVALLITMSILMGFFATFIIPQFRQIFWEFALELPPVTEVVTEVADETVVWGFILIATVVALLALFVIGVFYLLDMPVLRGLTDLVFRPVHAAEALRLLALAIDHRAEMPRALYALSVTHPVKAIRNRLASAYQGVASGKPWVDVLTQNRLLTRNERGLVETAGAVGNVPWALRQIALRRETQLAARMTLVGHIAYPMIILLFSAAVAAIAIGLFLPIVKLTEGLS